MNVALAHNYYQLPGGEDEVFANESTLLEANGHRVLRYTVRNDQVKEMNTLALAKATVWNRAAYEELRNLLRKWRPKVIHFHNTFPLISPAAYRAARAEGVPVVQTLHNYRLLCPSALFFRDGRACEDCLGKAVPWPGVVHACYRGSRLATGVTAGMLSFHRAIGTWREDVDAYIALTEFARRKFIEGGIPGEKILVKPNFIHPDPGQGEGQGGYALFVGRLSVEKGIDTLLEAWEYLEGKVPLKILGDGPLAERVSEATRKLEGVEWLGRQPKERVLTLMKEARVLIFPSTWYEGFPMVIAEAYAVGLPVIAGDLGGMSSLIEHDRTGLRFRTGDAKDLVAQMRWLLAHPTRLAAMRREARAEFETKYTAERNYEMLMKIYGSVAERYSSRAVASGSTS